MLHDEKCFWSPAFYFAIAILHLKSAVHDLNVNCKLLGFSTSFFSCALYSWLRIVSGHQTAHAFSWPRFIGCSDDTLLCEQFQMFPVVRVHLRYISAADAVLTEFYDAWRKPSVVFECRWSRRLRRRRKRSMRLSSSIGSQHTVHKASFYRLNLRSSPF